MRDRGFPTQAIVHVNRSKHENGQGTEHKGDTLADSLSDSVGDYIRSAGLE